MRSLQPGWEAFRRALAVFFSLFFLYSAVAPVPLHVMLPFYIGATHWLVLMSYPATRRSPKDRPSLVDVLLMLAALASNVYFSTHYLEMVRRAGVVHLNEVVFGLVVLLLSLETCRRVLGWPLPVLAVLFVLYDFLGPYLPPPLDHRGFSLARVISQLYSTGGIYGLVAQTFATYVVPFLIFAGVLGKTGAGEAYTRLAMALVGRTKGGVAKACAASSVLTGMVLGSGAADIVVSGSVTIPLMKRTGFRPHEAAAVEVSSSVGSHLMPPVMGAAAFLMASFTGIPYHRIALHAALVGLLYYVGVYASVHFLCMKHPHVTALRPDEVPSFVEALRENWPFLLPVVALVVGLGMGFSPSFAAVVAIVVAGLASMMRRQTRLSAGQWLDALAQGAQDSLVVGVTAAPVGTLLAALLLPGAALLFASWVVHFAGGKLFLALIFTALASFILGMGVSVSATYVLLAVVAAPALIEMKVPTLAAHMFVLWVSQYATFTPPFALAAYVGAALAGANPFQTALKSMSLAKPMYIIAFQMMYSPLLFLNGLRWDAVASFLLTAVGLVAFSALAERYLLRALRWPEMGAAAAATVMLLVPGNYLVNAGGLALFGLLVVYQTVEVRRSPAPAAAGVGAGVPDRIRQLGP